ncbi:hypothetical protein [Deinococcus apachensis]|nr:hypothetical protein [Deinococcus apachensis]
MGFALYVAVGPEALPARAPTTSASGRREESATFPDRPGLDGF